MWTERNDDRHAPAAWQRWLVLWSWLVYSLALLATSLIPGEDVPDVALLGWDKLAHAVAFAVLSALTFGVLVRYRRQSMWILLYGALIGAATEWLQGFAPGRSVSFYDWVADLAGTVVVAAIAGLAMRGKPRRGGGDERVRSGTREETVLAREA